MTRPPSILDVADVKSEQKLSQTIRGLRVATEDEHHRIATLFATRARHHCGAAVVVN